MIKDCLLKYHDSLLLSIYIIHCGGTLFASMFYIRDLFIVWRTINKGEWLEKNFSDRHQNMLKNNMSYI